jgi:hypothetical protein
MEDEPSDQSAEDGTPTPAQPAPPPPLPAKPDPELTQVLERGVTADLTKRNSSD